MNTEYESWEQRFRPIENPSSEGNLFETYGNDLKWVMHADPMCVWTLIDNEGSLIIVNGFALVNRIGYFLTELPFLGDPRELLIHID